MSTSSCASSQVRSLLLSSLIFLRSSLAASPTSDCRNPQTFQQGLLLVSALARLVPGQVLQNVLPIFISVGANAVQRDDAFTFNVVEKVRFSVRFSSQP